MTAPFSNFLDIIQVQFQSTWKKQFQEKQRQLSTMLKLLASQRRSTAVLFRTCLPSAVSWNLGNTHILKDFRRSMSDDCHSVTKPTKAVSWWYLAITSLVKVHGTSFQVFWMCKLWKDISKNQLNIITKFVYDSIAKFVLVQNWQLFCHHLLPWQRYLMIVQTYFWASNAYILKTNLVTPNFFHISFFVIWKWNYMII